jgi:CelD/BcsL family acetyltransferase involved in cellulose biosynthesis
VLQLAFLRVDGVAVAFEYNLRDHDVHYRLKAGFDPAWNKYAPGKLLNHAVIEDCFSGSIREFEFLGADEPYKLEWASEFRERLLVQAFAPSLAGRIERAAYDYGRPLAKRAMAIMRR